MPTLQESHGPRGRQPEQSRFWVSLFQEAAITLRIISETRHLSIADLMSIHSDLTLGTTPIQVSEAHGGRNTGGNDIGQHLARSYTGKLINIANQYQMRSQRQRTEHGIEQKQIDHTGFVDDQHRGSQWIVFRVEKGAVFGLIR